MITQTLALAGGAMHEAQLHALLGHPCLAVARQPITLSVTNCPIGWPDHFIGAVLATVECHCTFSQVELIIVRAVSGSWRQTCIAGARVFTS